MVILYSTVGTSLLTNTNQPKSLIYKHANARESEDVPSDERQQLQHIIDDTAATLQQAGESDARKMSAELNGLLAWIRSENSDDHVHHVLIATDTWLGGQTTRLVADWLRSHGHSTALIHATDVQTADFETFRLGNNELLGQLARQLPVYREKGYWVVFNLTGGFKGVNGFLQAVGSVYADEIIYLFERSSHLLRIPRLPVQLDPVAVVEPHLLALRRLDLGLDVPADTPIHESMIDRIDDEITLSSMGHFLFESAKDSLYKKSVHPPPSDRVRFGPRFLSSAKIFKDRWREINLRLDQLARLIEDQSSHLKGLDLKPLKGKKRTISTHEIDLWSDGATGRAFLHRDDDGAWVVDTIGPALH